MIKAFLERLSTKGSFASNVATLGSGTALGQVVIILSAPLLSRLFTPADFGQLQFILSTALILATFSTLRYEMSIPLPKEDSDAFRLVKLSISLAILTTLIVLTLIVIANAIDYSAEWWIKYSKLVLFVPIILMIEATNSTFGYWFMRKGNYKSPSLAKAISGIGVVTFQLIMHFVIALGGVGLLIGQSLGQLSGVSFLFTRLQKAESDLTWRQNWNRTKALALKYKDFPLFASWSAGLNTLGRHLPPIMMTWYYSPELVGYYAIGMRLLNIPLNLLSMSVGQVFFQQISKYVKNQVPVFPFLRSTALKLAILGFPGLLIIFLAGPMLFEWIFGDNWSNAGKIASILTPYFFLRFIASPLSPIFALVGKQYLSLIWQALFTLLTFGVIFFGQSQYDFYGVMWLYSIISGVMFFLFLVLEVFVSYTFDQSIKSGERTARFD